MKYDEKLKFLQDNHFSEWLHKRQKVEDEISNRQTMACVCGRLATGLHESNCRKFRNKVQRQAVKELSHLIPKKGEVAKNDKP